MTYPMKKNQETNIHIYCKDNKVPPSLHIRTISIENNNFLLVCSMIVIVIDLILINFCKPSIAPVQLIYILHKYLPRIPYLPQTSLWSSDWTMDPEQHLVIRDGFYFTSSSSFVFTRSSWNKKRSLLNFYTSSS